MFERTLTAFTRPLLCALFSSTLNLCYYSGDKLFLPSTSLQISEDRHYKHKYLDIEVKNKMIMFMFMHMFQGCP